MRRCSSRLPRISRNYWPEGWLPANVPFVVKPPRDSHTGASRDACDPCPLVHVPPLVENARGEQPSHAAKPPASARHCVAAAYLGKNLVPACNLATVIISFTSLPAKLEIQHACPMSRGPSCSGTTRARNLLATLSKSSRIHLVLKCT